MHEYSIMSSMVSALLDEVKGKKIQKIKSVHVEVGELTFLNPDSLDFAFGILAVDTILEGAALEVDEIKASIRCEKCGYTGSVSYTNDPAFHFNIPVITCPECNGRPEIVKGKEIVITSIRAEEVEDEG